MDKGYIDIYDTTVAVWETMEDGSGRNFSCPMDRSVSWEADMRKRIFVPVLSFMRRRGWTISEDPQVVKHYPTLRKNRRVACKGELFAKIELTGRHFSAEIWQDKYNITHKSGGRYEFQKRQRMPYLLGLRCDLEMRKLVEFLQGKTGYEITDHRHHGELADAAIQRHMRDPWHFKEELGHADWHGAYNRTSRDGKLLEHGQTVWFYGRDGRLRRAQAFYNLNNMWWVRLNRFEFTNLSCGYLFTAAPEDPRIRHNEEQRRRRLEQEISKAVESMNFQRAAMLKGLLFHTDKLFRIWSKKEKAFYRAQSCGYTNSTTHAGLYSEAEARSIVEGHSNLLELRPVA